MDRDDLIPIGVLAQRTGVAVSAIRYYEDQGLIHSMRTAGNQRRFLRSDIRRLSFVVIAQKLGLGLSEIEVELSKLPRGRSASQADWYKLNRSMRAQLDAKIQMLTRTRAKLDECMGCGCLSFERCRTHNKDDRAGRAGPGPRYVLA